MIRNTHNDNDPPTPKAVSLFHSFLTPSLSSYFLLPCSFTLSSTPQQLQKSLQHHQCNSGQLTQQMQPSNTQCKQTMSIGLYEIYDTYIQHQCLNGAVEHNVYIDQFSNNSYKSTDVVVDILSSFNQRNGDFAFQEKSTVLQICSVQNYVIISSQCS